MATWLPRPGRGPWAFRNLSRDFAFWPRLESIEITREEPTGLANLDCEVVLTGDQAGLVFIEEDECEVTYRDVRIWGGHLNAVDDSGVDEFGDPMVTLSGQDYTAKLDDALIRRRRKRKKERMRRRIRWILRNLRPSIWTLDDIDLSQLPEANPFIEAYDYFGDSIREALEHVSAEQRLSFYVDVDNVFRIFRTDSTPAPFDLDNDDPDYVTRFPYSEWHEVRESTELGNAFLVEPEKRKHAVWRTDPTSIAAYARHERFLSDGNLHRKAQARNMGDRALAQSSTPDRDVELVCWEPGLLPGHTLNVREARWDRELDLIVESVTMRGVDPHDDAGEAYLRSEVGLTDKRRPRIRRGTRTGLNKEIRRRPGQTADTDAYPLDGFSRTVASADAEEGDGIPATTSLWKLSQGEDGGSFSDPDDEDTYTPGAPFGPTIETSHATHYVESASGIVNIPHGSSPCPIGPGAWAGWRETERWANVATIPAHPTDLAGIYIDVTMGGGNGVHPGGTVMVLDHEPTALREGTVIGYAPASALTVIFIPAHLVPAEGDRLWVGVGPAWYANYEVGWYCSTSYRNPLVSGQNNSGRLALNSIADPRWAITSDDLPDFGLTSDQPKAPWGRWAWEVIGVEGSPVFGMDGDALFVTGEGGVGWALRGERENESADYGFWSDVAYGIEVEWRTDDVSGGSIEVSAIGEGESALGSLQLGSGIVVYGPTTTDSAAVAFTADTRWRAVFDTRANKVRGKAWDATAGPEPANWDATCAMDETEDDGDRLVLWLRAEAGQTIRVTNTRAMAGARDGQRVVRELVGFTDGLTRGFTTRHPFREGTLRAHVNGVGIAPASEDGDAAEYVLPFYPTAGSAIRNTYIADQGSGD